MSHWKPERDVIRASLDNDTEQPRACGEDPLTSPMGKEASFRTKAILSSLSQGNFIIH
jgi:hypothetical protein